MKKRHYIIPIFVPFMGCRHKCVFCDQEKITGIKTSEIAENTDSKIKKYLQTIYAKKEEKSIEIGYYGGSFTGLPFAIQEEFLAHAKVLKEQGLIDNIRLSTRPDYINPEVISFLLKNQVGIIELGVQSLAEDVLIGANRGHDVNHVIRAAKLIKAADFKLGIQLMIGLPKDTPAKAVATAKASVSLDPDFVRIYPTVVLKGTELAKQYEKGLYKPWSLAQVIEVAKKMVYNFVQNNIPVIRIGLQDTQSLKEKHLLAGPYHPAMGEKVEAAIFLDMMVYLIEGADCSQNKLNVFLCAGANESKVRGHKSENMIVLAQKYPQKKFLIKTSPNIPADILGYTQDCEAFPENLLTKQEFIGLQRI